MYRYALILLFALLGGPRLLADAESDRRILHAIEEQLEALLNRIKGGDEAQYGFRADDDIDECVPGRPYRLLLLSQEFYSSDLVPDKDYLLTKNEWRVPVKMKGQNRNMLTVTGTSGNYLIDGMGDTTLAHEVQMIGKSKDENNAYYLLYVERLNVYFFVEEADNSFTDAHFIPLESTIPLLPSLRTNYKPFYTLTETEEIIKQALSRPAEAAPKKAKPAPAKKKTAK